MIHFNRQERAAVLFLTGALLVGTGVAVVDHFRPERLEDFHVVRGAVEVPPAAVVEAAPETPQIVAVNRASAAELEQLPNVGPKTAAAIIAHRDAHGPFVDADDLTAVPGIGRRTVDRLRPLISTD